MPAQVSLFVALRHCFATAILVLPDLIILSPSVAGLGARSQRRICSSGSSWHCFRSERESRAGPAMPRGGSWRLSASCSPGVMLCGMSNPIPSFGGTGKGFSGSGAGNGHQREDRPCRRACASLSEIAAANVTWGEERIANELNLKLGIRVSPRTVGKYLRTGRPPRTPDPKQRWLTFVCNHAQVIVAGDFFVVVTATFRTLYVFVMMELGSRRILHHNVTLLHIFRLRQARGNLPTAVRSRRRGPLDRASILKRLLATTAQPLCPTLVEFHPMTSKRSPVRSFPCTAVVRNKFRSALRSPLLEPVLVVESAQNGNASDRVIVRNTVTMLVVWYECRQPRRDSRAQTHVRSRRVEMSNPGLQHNLRSAH